MSDAETPLPPIPTFAPEERVCGNCKLWQAHSVDARGWVGPCRLQTQRGLFPPTAPICDKFAPRSGAAPIAAKKAELEPAARQARAARSVAPWVRRQQEPEQVQQTVDLGDLNMTRDELMEIFREAANDADPPALAGKWEGGVIQLIPGNRSLAPAELPIDRLFHKVVMVRDRLRTLEQKINGNPKLSDAEKVEMQGYITRVYGSLTSFNLLFKDRGDQFSGAKGDE